MEKKSSHLANIERERDEFDSFYYKNDLEGLNNFRIKATRLIRMQTEVISTGKLDPVTEAKLFSLLLRKSPASVSNNWERRLHNHHTDDYKGHDLTFADFLKAVDDAIAYATIFSTYKRIGDETGYQQAVHHRRRRYRHNRNSNFVQYQAPNKGQACLEEGQEH